MLRSLLKNKAAWLLVFLYLAQLGWWLVMKTSHPSDTEKYWFNMVYGNIALLGLVSAFVIAHRTWGGWSSLIGRMLIFLGLGLLLEWLGIATWFYYNLSGAQVPYPSFADIGYFGLVPMYIIASIMLARASGLHFALRSSVGKTTVLLLPLAALGIAFTIFLRNIGYASDGPLKLFFDIGYPVGEIIPVTIAMLVLLLSTRGLSGGVMKTRILWLIFAFFMQFLTEYVFLYRAGAGTYQNADISDMLYATSYLVMGLGVLSFARIEQSNSSTVATAPATPQ